MSLQIEVLLSVENRKIQTIETWCLIAQSSLRSFKGNPHAKQDFDTRAVSENGDSLEKKISGRFQVWLCSGNSLISINKLIRFSHVRVVLQHHSLQTAIGLTRTLVATCTVSNISNIQDLEVVSVTTGRALNINHGKKRVDES